jgi:hypothetical protein
MKDLKLLRMVLGSGLLAGIALAIMTFLVARYGPQGDSWSFRGNGALIVPVGLGPAVLAGVWTALVLHYRSSPRWLMVSVGAGLVGALFVVASIAVILFGTARLRLSNSFIISNLAWMVVAPVLAAVLPVAGRSHERTLRLLVVHVAAAVLCPVALAGGLLAASRVLPPGA